MDSLAFLPLRCPSNSLIMASFYILVLIYASCGTLWICWLSPVPSRPLVWTCCKSFHVLYAFIFPTIGQNVLWSCFFIILHIVIYRFCLKIDLQCDQKKSSRSQFFPVNKKYVKLHFDHCTLKFLPRNRFTMWPEKIQAANFSLPKISAHCIVIWIEIVEYLHIVI